MEAKDRALELIANVCEVDVDTLTPETQLVADLGVDSARALHLLVKLEDKLDVEIDDDEVAGLQTVGDLLSALERQQVADQG